MRKLIKVIIVFSIIFLVAGSGLVAYGIARNEYKNNIGDETIQNYSYVDDFNNINLDTEITNINITLNNENKTDIICNETEKIKHEIKIENDSLIIKQYDLRKWYEKIINFGFFNNISIEIKLAKNAYNELKIHKSTGDLIINNNHLNFNSVNIESSTGAINIDSINASNTFKAKASTGSILINNLKAKDCDLEVSAGNIILNNSIIDNKIIISASTGSINFDKIDAATLKISASTGSIRGSILTPKTFKAKASTGSVNVPNTTGGLCEINTSTGSINVTVINI